MQQCIKIFIISYLYEAQHVSGNTPPIIRSLKLHLQPLVFHTWKVVGHVVGGCCQAHCAWQHPPTTHPTTFHVWKTRGCQCSFRLLMMGGVLPETCWASYKHAWQHPPTTRPTTFHIWKTRGCQCSFRLLMMGGVSPETCWASYKYAIIKMLIHCCILLDFSLWIVLWCTDPQMSNEQRIMWLMCACNLQCYNNCTIFSMK